MHICCCYDRILNGEISFEEFVVRCLEAIKPSKAVIESSIKECPHEIVPYVKEFIALCKEKGKKVFLVSSGYVPVFSIVLYEK